jgi:membrane protease YdiL (CAAX protease family)
MLDEWLTTWGRQIPEVVPSLPIWPVVAVIVLMLMVNVAAHKAVQDYYLFWTLGGSVVVLALGLLDGCTWGDLGLSPRTWIPGAIWGGAAMGIIFAVYAIGSSWRRTRGAFRDADIAGLSKPRLFWQSLVELPLGTVLFEEIAFRGVLWAMLARRYGVVWATVWSSLLFGLWHILPSLNLHERHERLGEVGGLWGRLLGIVGSVVTTMIGGVLFSLLRIGSGSLLAPMGLHWSTNGWGYLFARRVASKGP